MYNGKKYNIEDIRTSMGKEGYTLVSDTYSSVTKLKYICPVGHEAAMLSCNWNKGKRCSVCYKLNKNKNKHLAKPINEIKASFANEGYTLLTSDYKNNRQKLAFVCNNGHRHEISWLKWNDGRRCIYCSSNAPVDMDCVTNSFEGEGYTLLSKTYNYHIKLDYICSLGHINSIAWGHWQQGKRCPTCQKINRFGSGHPNWKGGISCEPYCQDCTKEYKEFIKERDGYRCLNPYCYKGNIILGVHHIDYNKKLCGPENLITVCRSCNTRANKDREWHRTWYQAILSKRYGYKYESSKTVGEITNA